MVLLNLILPLGLMGAAAVYAIPAPASGNNNPHPGELPGCGEVNVILTYVVHPNHYQS